MFRRNQKLSPRLVQFGAIAAAATMGLCGSVHAGITGVSGGPSLPSSTLGGYTMTAFTADTTSPSDDHTSSIPTPLGSSIALSTPMIHTTVGDYWGTWSNNYTGDVYYLVASETDAQNNAAGASATPLAPSPGLPDVTLTLPADTGAVYLYVEPSDFGDSEMTVTATDGVTSVPLVQSVDGNAGAAYYGFYALPGDSISSLTVSSGDPSGYAIGEFGIATAAVPEPASFGLLTLAATGLLGRRRTGATK
jgi:hypothetical protein